MHCNIHKTKRIWWNSGSSLVPVQSCFNPSGFINIDSGEINAEKFLFGKYCFPRFWNKRSDIWVLVDDGGSLSSPHSGNKIQFITHPHVIIIYPPPHHNQQHHFTSQSRYWFAFTVTGYLQCKYAYDFRADAGTGRNREHISADRANEDKLGPGMTEVDHHVAK